MKILVVSDTHGRWGALYNVIRSHPDAGTVIHLGDGNDDLERLRPEFAHLDMYGVLGNCDFSFGTGLSSVLTVTIEKKVIFCTHGHNYRVKAGYSMVEAAARARSADICLFGHTHEPFCECRSGLYMMNPGSLGHPRDRKPSCGIIDITSEGISARLVECDI